MNYIVLDLEWNQGSPDRDKQDPVMPFEVIEIGAVKLDEERRHVSDFSELVRPVRYRTMHYVTGKLLHLSMQDLAGSDTFPEVCERFLAWCGEEPRFVTWGPLDLTEFQRNMAFHEMQALSDRPLRFYDAQKLFALAYQDRKSRVSLEKAIDFEHLEKDVPFHRAHDDAYYTAEIFARLPEGVLANYSFDYFTIPRKKENEVHVRFADYAKYISRGFPDKNAALEDGEVMGTTCFLCGKPLRRRVVPWFTPNGKHYYSVSVCPEHGYMKAKVRLRKAEDGQIYIVKTERFIGEGDVKKLKNNARRAAEANHERNRFLHHRRKAGGAVDSVSQGASDGAAVPVSAPKVTKATAAKVPPVSGRKAVKITALLLGLGLSLALLPGKTAFAAPAPDPATAEDPQAAYEARKSEPVASNSVSGWPQGPAIGAEGAILMDADTGTILYNKNMDEQLYPASTTKLMTCLIAVENLELSDVVEISENAVNSVPADGSSAGMRPGESLTVEESLYAILVASANEVATAVGEKVAGSVEAFADLMNERAAELGCTNTHFCNANGLHEDDHYTSPHDLSLIMQAVLQNETLRGFIDTPQYHFEPTAGQPRDFIVVNKNKLITGEVACSGILGGKTGFTGLARQTLVTACRRGDMTLICVVMKEEDPNQYLDSAALYEYGFAHFTRVKITDQAGISVTGGAPFFTGGPDLLGTGTPLFTTDGSDYADLPEGVRFDELTKEISYPEETTEASGTGTAPADAGNENGIAAEMRYSWGGVTVGTLKLYPNRDTGGAAGTTAPDTENMSQRNTARAGGSEDAPGTFLSSLKDRLKRFRETVVHRNTQGSLMVNVRALILLFSALAVLLIVVITIITWIVTAGGDEDRLRRRRHRRRGY